MDDPSNSTADFSHMLWRINQRCNFRCAYCFRPGVNERQFEEHPDCRKYTAQFIADAFQRTGRKWRIHMTGGEPFLYPDFVRLLTELQKRNEISVNTNLSQPVDPFIRQVSPGAIYAINASAHVAELEAKCGGLDPFARRVLQLQDSGFYVQVFLVSYPPELPQLAARIERLRELGVQRVSVKIFRGDCAGKSYPGAFTPAERRQIQAFGLSPYEEAILADRINFAGGLCSAGYSAFNMDVSGRITQCSAIGEICGNLFDGTFQPLHSPQHCRAPHCICPYQGLKFSKVAGIPLGRTSFRQLCRRVTGRIVRPASGRAA